jgi:hypothetical protein
MLLLMPYMILAIGSMILLLNNILINKMENTIINKQKEIVNLIINKSTKDSKFKNSLILNLK